MFRKGVSFFLLAAWLCQPIGTASTAGASAPLCFLAPPSSVVADPIGIQTKENSRERKIVEAIAIAQSTSLALKIYYEFRNTITPISTILQTLKKSENKPLPIEQLLHGSLRKIKENEKGKITLTSKLLLGKDLEKWREALSRRNKTGKNYLAIIDYYLNDGVLTLEYDPEKDLKKERSELPDLLELGKSRPDLLQNKKRTDRILELENKRIHRLRSLTEKAKKHLSPKRYEDLLESLKKATLDLGALANVLNFIQSLQPLEIHDLRQCLSSLEQAWNRLPRAKRFDFVLHFDGNIQMDFFPEYRIVTLKPILPVLLSVINELFAKGPPKHRANVLVHFEKQQDQIVITLKSDFSSIPPDEVNNRLFVLSSKFPALAGAHEWAALSHGTLTVEPGEGRNKIVFTLCLPTTPIQKNECKNYRWVSPVIETTQESEPAPAAEDLPEPELSPLKVLLVDDNEKVMDSLKGVLFAFFKIKVKDGKKDKDMAEDGLAGFEKYKEAQERGKPYDLIITDLSMPRCSGEGLATRIREQDKNTKIFLYSGYYPDPQIEELLARGLVDDAFGKPFNAIELGEKIEKVFPGKKPLPLAVGNLQPVEASL